MAVANSRALRRCCTNLTMAPRIALFGLPSEAGVLMPTPKPPLALWTPDEIWTEDKYDWTTSATSPESKPIAVPQCRTSTSGVMLSACKSSTVYFWLPHSVIASVRVAAVLYTWSRTVFAVLNPASLSSAALSSALSAAKLAPARLDPLSFYCLSQWDWT